MIFYFILIFFLVVGMTVSLNHWINLQELKDLKPGDPVTTDEGPDTFTSWTVSGLVLVELAQGSMIFPPSEIRKRK